MFPAARALAGTVPAVKFGGKRSTAIYYPSVVRTVLIVLTYFSILDNYTIDVEQVTSFEAKETVAVENYSRFSESGALWDDMVFQRWYLAKYP